MYLSSLYFLETGDEMSYYQSHDVSLRSRGDRVVARSVRKDLMMIKNSEPVDSN